MKRRSKGRTWAEAAKLVLEKFPQTPLSHKEILRIIQNQNLKDLSGTAPLLCLNSCLHANSRGRDCVFYKVAGKSGVYGLMSDLPEGSVLCEVDEDSDSLTELVDENGRPVLSGQSSSRSFTDKRKDKVMHVKLPKDHSFYSRVPEEHGMRGFINGQSSDTSSTTVSVGDMSEVSEAPSTDTQMSSVSSVDVGKEELPPAIDHLPVAVEPTDNTTTTEINNTTSTTLITAANRLAAAKRKNRNNPLRHYTKRRKKKNRFSRIKVHNSNSGIKGLRNSKGSSPGLSSGVDSSGSPSPTVQTLTGRTRGPRKTLREMLAGLPGYSMKPKNRKNQRLSMAAQIQQTKEGCIDLENPTSILVNTNLKTLINKHTFNLLPPAYQYKVMQLLPTCDQIHGPENSLRMASSALNNEFFSKACGEWRDRLADGEFTQETQLRIKLEEEKQQSKLDPWKVKHFEPVWGKRSLRSPIAFPKTTPPFTLSATSDSRVPVTQPINVAITQAPTIRSSSTFSAMHRPRPKAKLVSAMLKERALSQNIRQKQRQQMTGGIKMSAQEILDTVMKQREEMDKKASLQKQAFASTAGNNNNTKQQTPHSHNLLLQQLKRPSEISTDASVPLKKVRSQATTAVFNTNTFSTAGSAAASINSENEAAVAHSEALASKNQSSNVHIQNVSIKTSQPLLSGLAAVSSRSQLGNQKVGASSPARHVVVASSPISSSSAIPLSETNPIVQQFVANAQQQQRKYQMAAAALSSANTAHHVFGEARMKTVSPGSSSSNSNTTKTIAQFTVQQQAAAAQHRPPQQRSTRTLADIKANTKAKAHNRQMPFLIQGKQRPVLALNQRVVTPVRPMNQAGTSGDMSQQQSDHDLQRPQIIVKQQQTPVVAFMKQQHQSQKEVSRPASQSLQNLVLAKQRQELQQQNQAQKVVGASGLQQQLQQLVTSPIKVSSTSGGTTSIYTTTTVLRPYTNKSAQANNTTIVHPVSTTTQALHPTTHQQAQCSNQTIVQSVKQPTKYILKQQSPLQQQIATVSSGAAVEHANILSQSTAERLKAIQKAATAKGNQQSTYYRTVHPQGTPSHQQTVAKLLETVSSQKHQQQVVASSPLLQQTTATPNNSTVSIGGGSPQYSVHPPVQSNNNSGKNSAAVAVSPTVATTTTANNNQQQPSLVVVPKNLFVPSNTVLTIDSKNSIPAGGHPHRESPSKLSSSSVHQPGRKADSSPEQASVRDIREKLAAQQQPLFSSDNDDEEEGEFGVDVANKIAAAARKALDASCFSETQQQNKSLFLSVDEDTTSTICSNNRLSDNVNNEDEEVGDNEEEIDDEEDNEDLVSKITDDVGEDDDFESFNSRAEVGSNSSVSTIICNTSVTGSNPGTPTTPGGGGIPKLKFVRVKNSDGESRYVLKQPTSSNCSGNDSPLTGNSSRAQSPITSIPTVKSPSTASISDAVVSSVKNNTTTVTTVKHSVNNSKEGLRSALTAAPNVSVVSSEMTTSPVKLSKVKSLSSQTTVENKSVFSSVISSTISTQIVTVPNGQKPVVNSNIIQTSCISSSRVQEAKVTSLGSAKVSTPLGKSSFSSSHPSLQRLLSGENILTPGTKIAPQPYTQQYNAVTTTSNSNPKVIAKSSHTFNTTTASKTVSQAALNSHNLGNESALLQALKASPNYKAMVNTTLSLHNAVPVSYSKYQYPNVAQKNVLEDSVYSRIGVISSSNGTTKVNLQGVVQKELGRGGDNSVGSVAEAGIVVSSSCVCSMKAFSMCPKCGAYCHNDCVGPLKYCVNCVMAT